MYRNENEITGNENVINSKNVVLKRKKMQDKTTEEQLKKYGQYFYELNRMFDH